jgi:hypothetical protein
VSIAFSDKIFELKRTRVFVIPPIRQHFKVRIHSVGILASPRFKCVKHGYMSISPPDSHSIIDITIYMDVASNPGPASNRKTEPKRNGMEVLYLNAPSLKTFVSLDGGATKVCKVTLFLQLVHLSFIDLERGGIGEILPEVMIFPEGLCPEGNIITKGNISPNPPSRGSVNDILYRKLKASKLRIKNLTHTFVNKMFHFRINASIVAFLSNHISFGILMTTFFKICFKTLKKPQALRLNFHYSSHINTIYILSAMLLSCVLSRVVYANNVPPHVPRGTWGGTLSKGTQAP